MCEFLIRAEDSTHKANDPEARYMRGDIIQVYPDGTCTEPISNSKMKLIKIPEIEYEKAVMLMECEVELQAIDGELREIPIKKRIYRFNLDDLPAKAKTDLDSNKETEIKEADATIYNKVQEELWQKS